VTSDGQPTTLTNAPGTTSMTVSAHSLNRLLRIRLLSMLQDEGYGEPDVPTPPDPNLDIAAPVHVVITSNEVNHLHGTGPLVQRICNGWQNVFSLRARNDWGGLHEFGDWNVRLSPIDRSRAAFFRATLRLFRGRTVETILCVPFLPDDLLTAIAVQASFGAQLCAYVMDDQNVATHNLSDNLMREFLERCSLRLVTHPELRYAYESKYQLPFHILPAIAPAQLVATDALASPVFDGRRRGAMIGSFWEQSWFDRLCSELAECGWEIDWFGNNKSPWLDLSPQSLAKAGIEAHGIVPEPHLATELQKYPFVIVPVSALDDQESNPGVASLSLPGRILFALATSHTPILVVGSSRTCAARFVTHFGVGEVAPYESAEIGRAMERLSMPEKQERMRSRATSLAAALSDEGVADWLQRSIKQGGPADDRFERLFVGYDPAVAPNEVEVRSMALRA
jgi:hypothetical protein